MKNKKKYFYSKKIFWLNLNNYILLDKYKQIFIWFKRKKLI